jgi:hypothetical protein
MKVVLALCYIFVCSLVVFAQTQTNGQTNNSGPQVTHLVAEIFPVNKGAQQGVVTMEYGGRIFETEDFRATMFGFADFRTRSTMRPNPTIHTQSLYRKGLPVGFMAEEGWSQSGFFVRGGPSLDVLQSPRINKQGKQAFKQLNISWLLPITGPITQEVKITWQTKNAPLIKSKWGAINSGGFGRWRYQKGRSIFQPQLRYQPPRVSWVQGVIELDWSGTQRNWYAGAKLNVLSLVQR